MIADGIMADNLREHLEALGPFLDKLRSNACFAQAVQVQRQRLESFLGSVALSPGEASSVTDLVQDMPWPAGDLDHILAAVVASTGTCPGVDTHYGRLKLQDYAALNNYFTKAQWFQLLSDDLGHDDKLQLICDHAVALGLRNPTEITMRAIAALFLLSSDGHAKARVMSPGFKNQMFRHSKRLFKALSLIHI